MSDERDESGLMFKLLGKVDALEKRIAALEGGAPVPIPVHHMPAQRAPRDLPPMQASPHQDYRPASGLTDDELAELRSAGIA